MCECAGIISDYGNYKELKGLLVHFLPFKDGETEPVREKQNEATKVSR